VYPAEPEEPPFDNSFENVVEVPEINPRYKIRDATFFLEERPPIEYLIDDLITVGSVNLWVGKFGSKKTWSAISAAVCVAAGKTWLGMKVKQGTVLIVDEESGEDRLSRRINLALRGELVQNEKIPIKSVSLAQFNLLKTPDDIRELTSLILSVDASLVIIDALSDIMAGGDENSVKDTQPVCMALRRIADFTKTAIILIHHVNKNGDYRGSSAIPGAVDTMLLIESAVDSNIISFKSEKVRDGEAVQFAAAANWTTDQFYLMEADYKKKKHLTNSEIFILNFLKDNGTSTIKDLCAFSGDLYTLNTLRSAVKSLISEKMIERINKNEKGVEGIYGIVNEVGG
jgi:hypothetical protein